MESYLTEAEQIEMIKQWWKKNGKLIIASVIIVIIASFAWRSWQQRHERMLEKASAIYERLLNAAANNDADNMEVQADRLIDHYRHTPYAQIAALVLARQAVYGQDLNAAEIKLRWIMKHGKNRALRQLARIRAARVLIAEHKLPQALELLEKTDDPSYLAAIKEITGDIYLAQGKTPEARQAYTEALAALPGIEVMQPLLQMKLDNLAPINESVAKPTAG